MERIELERHLEMEGEGEGWERAQGYVTSVAIWPSEVYHCTCGTHLQLVGGGGWEVEAVVLLILEKRRRSTCSFCSHVRSEMSTRPLIPSLHVQCTLRWIYHVQEVHVDLPLCCCVQVVIDTVSAAWKSSKCPHSRKLPTASGGLSHSPMVCNGCIMTVLRSVCQ